MRRLLAALALLPMPALAAPGFIPIQGTLTDDNGVAIDGAVNVTFRLVTDSTGATGTWSDTFSVDVVDGRFATELGGANNALDLSIFSLYPTVHLGITVEGDTEMPLVPLDHVPYAAWADHAGDAATLGGATLGGIRAEIPATSDLAQAARDAAYDTEAELTTVLDPHYDYSGGTGIDVTGTVISADQTQIEAWATGVCYDSPSELTAALSGTYQPDWTDIANIPSGFADNVDDDTQLSQTVVEGYARGVAYDTPAELTTALAGNYEAAGYTPDWNDLTSMPAGFADGNDDDNQLSRATVEGFARGVAYDTPGELTTALANTYVPAAQATRDENATPMRTCAGRTAPSDWAIYSTYHPVVDVDITGCGFTSKPYITIALHGSGSHWTTVGGSSVYSATKDGFRVHIRSVDSSTADTYTTAASQWYIEWIAVGN
ncbi:MAG: hypothetical protein KC912_03145 [Proteobacteria bacterium]|nr:hypothetical protein [Pseudomonadota bacterium]